MRIDVITIFPDYLAPLELSLIGQAREAGLIDVQAHDLRDFTHDRHRTVDDTPYGGGAGMVMKPEPWGEALDAVLARCPRLGTAENQEESGSGTALPATELNDVPLVVFPTPSGRVFNQERAQEWSTEERIVIGCGRYEGIDQRVFDYARANWRVAEVSLGDYVLNGGEVAALAMIEAVVRLIPGVIGNPESLEEESHSGAYKDLLEYPLYTKPSEWRGMGVPEVLLSGHHGNVDKWRRKMAVERTAQRRPDLLEPGRSED
ncbi:MAG: tRNA (guanosine(37)-N1)-methyltransferase TrmD [Propionibacteriaceae bacterium]|nr:tRNA (guanosine(37)-N1)-methyltransferase TrmD [Propionibacteriaceae bacterium]